MAAPTRTKSLLAMKAFPLDMSALIAPGAVLTAVQMTASRTTPYPLQATTLAAPVAIADGTVSLNVHPGVGALLKLEPGTGVEEALKVVSVSGSAPWVCTIKPVAWAAHSASAAVSYEPGVNTRLFVDDTPTPAGTQVTPFLQKGVYGQKYRISYLGTANDGQEVEDEFTLEVIDPAGIGPNIKQPSETRDLAADFTKPLEEPHQAGATLSSGATYVSSAVSSFTTQLSAQANSGATTLSLASHPGIGAMLILTPAGTGSTPPERVYVSNVTGTGPYTVTLVSDLEFTHASGADVTVFQGYSGAFLTSTTPTFQGLLAINRARRGQAGKTLKVAFVVTTSQGERLHGNTLVAIEET